VHCASILEFLVGEITSLIFTFQCYRRMISPSLNMNECVKCEEIREHPSNSQSSPKTQTKHRSAPTTYLHTYLHTYSKAAKITTYLWWFPIPSYI
jgi:hypothetical protein